MTISKEEVRYVAHLARLELDAAAEDAFAGQIDDILSYVDSLNRIDTTGVPPTSHALSLNNAFREDVPHEHMATDEALANAPEKEEGAFTVPKIIG